MSSSTLVDKRQELDASRKDAREFYAAHPDPKDYSGDDRQESIKHSKKMADIHDEVIALEADEKGREEANTARKSAGRAVDESDGEIKGASAKAFDLEDALANSAGMKVLMEKGNSFRGTAELVNIPSMKTLLTLADIAPQSARRPGIFPSVQDESTVSDLMLSGSTSSNVLSYYEETTFTNAAAIVDEAGTKPEAALDFTERTDTVRKIAVWIPATSEFLEDNDGVRSYIEQRLVFMLKQEEEDQLLNGDGTPPNISGVLDRSGVQSIGSTNDLDSIYQAITEVRVDGGAEPSAVVIHPLSWQNLRLAKDTNTAYYGPGPFAPDSVERIWGLQVRVTPRIAEGTALVGAFRPHAQVFRKGGISVLASTEHASYFIENKVAILVEERLALAVYRPSAFCSVTGLASS